MYKLIIFVSFLLAIFKVAFCQEIFIDVYNNQTNIFLGALNPTSDSLKTLEDGRCKWKCIKDLEQTDLLIGKEFIAEIFESKFNFVLEGYEPFWKVKINASKLIFFNYNNEENEEFKIEIYTNEYSMNSRFYMMFKDLNNGNIFGLINYLGWEQAHQKKCECNISEEISLFEAYIYIRGLIYRGCAYIESDN